MEDTSGSEARPPKKSCRRETIDSVFGTVDSNDYRVLEEVFLRIPAWTNTRKIVRVRNGKGWDPRVYSLDATRLSKIHKDRIESLPSTIGQLDNLEELVLRDTLKLFLLPEEIGNLTKLKTLCLSNSGIKSLPPSIGLLSNLEELNLSATNDLLELPKEIGNLTKLKTLCLANSGIKSLPPSVGQLSSLEELQLNHTEKLLDLPEEIGNLANLKILCLDHSGIKSLPPSVGQLSSLEELQLCYTKKLVELPEEIGNLANLKDLDIDDSNVKTVDRTIVQQLGHLQACKRAKSKIGFGVKHHDNRIDNRVNINLWPRILNRATVAFDDRVEGLPDCFQGYRTSQPDAIYQLFLDGRELFLQIIN